MSKAQHQVDGQAPLSPCAGPGLPRLLILDLDGVIWSGTISDDSVPIIPDEGMIRLVERLDERGVLVACTSKNNSRVALDVLRRLELLDRFVVADISFTPKPLAIQRTLQRLHVSPSQAVFVDDTPEEREMALERFPTMTVMDPVDAKRILGEATKRSNPTLSPEALNRKAHYLLEAERALDSAASRAEIAGFVATSSLSVYLSSSRPSELPRLAELYERSHRLNFSTRKRSLDELTHLGGCKDRTLLTVRVVDRYGPYGIVGAVLLAQQTAVLSVDDIILSCRVQGRMVEYALLDNLIGRARRLGKSRCRVDFTASEYNAHLSDPLKSFAFRPESGTGSWVLDLDKEMESDLEGIILPSVHEDDDLNDRQEHAGVPFVRRLLGRWASRYSFDGPFCSLGAGYDEVSGADWGNVLSRNADAPLPIRVDNSPPPGINVLSDAGDSLALRDSSIGTVACLDVLEHASRPWDVVRAVHRILRPGGLAIFSMPCLVGIHKATEDLWRLTPVGLERLVLEFGLDERLGTRLTICESSIEGHPAYPVRTALLVRKDPLPRNSVPRTTPPGA